MRALVPPGLAALALLPAACGGGGGGSSPASAPSSQACPKDAVVVHMRAIEFVPRTAAVKVGHRVCWVNDDDVQHDAVAEDGAFESPLYGQGQTYTTTVRRTGSIAYVCTVHPGMKGTLRVSP